MELNQLYTVVLKENAIPQQAGVELARWMDEYDGKSANVLRRITQFWEQGEWDKWITRGTWPKRFAKYCMDNYDLQVNPTVLSVLGERIKNYSKSTVSSWLEITQTVNWKSGDFMDNDSCWIKGGNIVDHTSVKDAFLESGNGYAVKFYESAEKYEKDRGKGIGRCWLYMPSAERAFVFNAKGITSQTAAMSMSKILEWSYKAMSLTILQSYVDGSHGYGLAPQEADIPDKYAMPFYDNWLKKKEKKE